MSNIFKKGNDLMKNIRLCQRLETSKDKTYLFPICNEPKLLVICFYNELPKLNICNTF